MKHPSASTSVWDTVANKEAIAYGERRITRWTEFGVQVGRSYSKCSIGNNDAATEIWTFNLNDLASIFKINECEETTEIVSTFSSSEIWIPSPPIGQVTQHPKPVQQQRRQFFWMPAMDSGRFCFSGRVSNSIQTKQKDKRSMIPAQILLPRSSFVTWRSDVFRVWAAGISALHGNKNRFITVVFSRRYLNNRIKHQSIRSLANPCSRRLPSTEHPKEFLPCISRVQSVRLENGPSAGPLVRAANNRPPLSQMQGGERASLKHHRPPAQRIRGPLTSPPAPPTTTIPKPTPQNLRNT